MRTRKRVVGRMAQFANEPRDSDSDRWGVQHIQYPENAQRLVEGCREIMGSNPIIISEVGPVIGAHTDPSMLGVGGVPSELLR